MNVLYRWNLQCLFFCMFVLSCYDRETQYYNRLNAVKSFKRESFCSRQRHAYSVFNFVAVYAVVCVEFGYYILSSFATRLSNWCLSALNYFPKGFWIHVEHSPQLTLPCSQLKSPAPRRRKFVCCGISPHALPPLELLWNVSKNGEISIQQPSRLSASDCYTSPRAARVQSLSSRFVDPNPLRGWVVHLSSSWSIACGRPSLPMKSNWVTFPPLSARRVSRLGSLLLSPSYFLVAVKLLHISFSNEESCGWEMMYGLRDQCVCYKPSQR